MRQSASRAPRWMAASALLVGGALAFAATFLPLGQAAYLPRSIIPLRRLRRFPRTISSQPSNSTSSIRKNPVSAAHVSGGSYSGERRSFWQPSVYRSCWRGAGYRQAGSLIACLALILVGVGYVIISCSFYLSARSLASRAPHEPWTMGLAYRFSATSSRWWASSGLAFQRGRRTSRAHTAMELTR